MAGSIGVLTGEHVGRPRLEVWWEIVSDVMIRVSCLHSAKSNCQD